MSTAKLTAGTSQSTGISSTTMNAGANLLSSEIDNATNKDRMLDLELAWTCSTASTAGYVVEVYILYAMDGTNYEDGGTSADPAKNPTRLFVDDGGTGAQRQTRLQIPLSPFKFKILLKSELDQNATAVALLAYTHNDDIS